MATGNDTNRNDYDTAATAAAQDRFKAVADHLEHVLNERDADVKAAMMDYFAQGVSDEYHGKERRWNLVGTEVRGIITTLRDSLLTSDGTAHHANNQAGQAVASI
jgi:hypothetical protein